MKDEEINQCFGDAKIPAYLEVFTNCREQGYCLSLYKPKNEDTMVYWVCEDRMSDKIMIVIGNYNQRDHVHCCFDDEAYKSAKYFPYNEMSKAIEYVYNHIKLKYKEELDFYKKNKFSQIQDNIDVKLKI